jgi:hypothetical protein
MWSSRVALLFHNRQSTFGNRRLAVDVWQSTIGDQELFLRAEAEEFSAEARVVLGLMEVGQFVGGGFGADDFD